MRAARYYMLCFDSMHRALEAERHLQPLVPVCAMPTLRAVTHSCGISLRVEEADAPALRKALLGGSLGLEGQYHLYHVEGEQPAQISPEGLG